MIVITLEKVHLRLFFDSAKSESEASSEKVVTHTVKEGETLESIAKQYFSDETGIEVIKKYNDLQKMK